MFDSLIFAFLNFADLSCFNLLTTYSGCLDLFAKIEYKYDVGDGDGGEDGDPASPHKESRNF
jgi:hypothetical protein